MKAEIAPLFRDVLLVCEEEGLLAGTFFALDGLKLPSNASMEWSGTHSHLLKKKDRLSLNPHFTLKDLSTKCWSRSGWTHLSKYMCYANTYRNSGGP